MEEEHTNWCYCKECEKDVYNYFNPPHTLDDMNKEEKDMIWE